ncbi:MFS transporter [Limimaricola pyoseonensis]|uniref:Predicted arabinose efflux permease, MFS family n=1 Tax=Limimaricola pyoseonensis TaxID=521013 RepID=A0A1G7FZK4_9RHOB|nr:MFS transporter [Limimaricola pyoseonensis]SDE81313.1 Predicted arabinose efflux permease, MFS family [Limimaricola pyoseonensis]
MTQTERSAGWLIIALWAAGLGAAAQFAKMAVIFPALQAAYPEAGAGLGLAVSLLSFLGIGLGLLAGLITARGPRRVLIFALGLGAAVSLFQALMPPLPVLLASRVVEGLSHLLIVVAAPSLIGQASAPRHRPLAMTLWSTFFGVAFALVAWFGPAVVARGGPALLFVLHAGAMATLALVLARMLPRRPPPGAPLPLDPRALLRRHVEIYRSPALSAPALGWLFYTLTFVSLMTVLPAMLAPAERALVAVTMPLAGIACALSLGVALLRRWPAVPVVVLGFGLALLAALGLVIWPASPWPPIALAATLGLVQAGSFTAIPQLNPAAEAQSLANGAVAQMGNLGNALGTPLLLWAVEGFGRAGMAGFLVGAYGLGIAVHLGLARRRGAGGAAPA